MEEMEYGILLKIQEGYFEKYVRREITLLTSRDVFCFDVEGYLAGL